MIYGPDTYICIIVKERSSKYRWMIALMISSQLLLTGFVCYWLISQYRQERIQLHGELQHLFLTVYDVQVDSLLMKHLITPTLNDSLMVRINLTDISTVKSISDSGHTSVVIKHVESGDEIPRELFAFHMDGSTVLDSLNRDSIHFLSIADEERLVRSVKLFINETDEALRTNAKAHVFSMEIDSAEFMLRLHETFAGRGWDFSLNWLMGSPHQADQTRATGLILLENPHMELPAIHVQHVAPYLLGILLPQFIFVLILLSLSASALIFVYRSLRKQLILNELRNDFISNISHELKTPVTTVKVALEALRTFDLKEDPKVSGEYLEMASREAERLERLVGKVLNHQLLEDPSAVVQKEQCDLRELVGNVLRTLEIPIREKGAEVVVQSPHAPCLVMGDPVYLEGVVVNLIDNSLKYAGPHPEIQIEIVCNDQGKLLKVKDQGPGIPDEYRDQVYKKFFRIPSGDHHNVKGYGLGLNFASRVMAHHGGSISFRNLPHRGCEFILNFPN